MLNTIIIGIMAIVSISSIIGTILIGDAVDADSKDIDASSITMAQMLDNKDFSLDPQDIKNIELNTLDTRKFNQHVGIGISAYGEILQQSLFHDYVLSKTNIFNTIHFGYGIDLHGFFAVNKYSMGISGIFAKYMPISVVQDDSIYANPIYKIGGEIFAQFNITDKNPIISLGGAGGMYYTPYSTNRHHVGDAIDAITYGLSANLGIYYNTPNVGISLDLDAGFDKISQLDFKKINQIARHQSILKYTVASKIVHQIFEKKLLAGITNLNKTDTLPILLAKNVESLISRAISAMQLEPYKLEARNKDIQNKIEECIETAKNTYTRIIRHAFLRQDFVKDNIHTAIDTFIKESELISWIDTLARKVGPILMNEQIKYQDLHTENAFDRIVNKILKNTEIKKIDMQKILPGTSSISMNFSKELKTAVQYTSGYKKIKISLQNFNATITLGKPLPPTEKVAFVNYLTKSNIFIHNTEVNNMENIILEPSDYKKLLANQISTLINTSVKKDGSLSKAQIAAWKDVYDSKDTLDKKPIDKLTSSSMDVQKLNQKVKNSLKEYIAKYNKKRSMQHNIGSPYAFKASCALGLHIIL